MSERPAGSGVGTGIDSIDGIDGLDGLDELDDLEAVLTGFAGRRVLVVGDVMLDEYLTGRVRRVSPEAPVPIVELEARTDTAGGAGNAASNITGLGGQAVLGALMGGDDNGRRLRTVLKRAGVDLSGAVDDVARPTTTKTRVVAGQQQIARVDVEDTAPIGVELAAQLLVWFRQACVDAHAVLLCDYGKGVLTPELCTELIGHARGLRLPVVVDPKGADFSKYRGATVITPNVAEVEVATQHVRPTPPDPVACAQVLVPELGGAAVLLTRGPDGMALFRPGVEPLSVTADTQRVFDVTGAGDTVVAVLALALGAGAGMEAAMRLANLAAGLVVARPGTTALQADELRAAVAAKR